MTSLKHSKYIQLYESVRDNIISGVYRRGEKLPSKRDMAVEMNVSVITVEHAYELLAEEGYIETREKSGYFVIFDRNELYVGDPLLSGKRNGYTGRQNSCGSKESSVLQYSAAESAASAGNPVKPVSFQLYARTARRVLSVFGDSILERSPGFGTDRLKQAISAYLARSRGIAAPADRLIIGSGAEYLYSLIVKALGRDKMYGIEDPSYMRIAQVYGAEGVRVTRLKLGQNGIESDSLWASGADALHITPYRSFPSGVTATASKRREYLDWCRRSGSVIIEDDFESEFSPLRKPEETLFSLDDTGSVIYVNTFTRTLGPFVRIAYMAVPDRLFSLFEDKLGFYACTVPTFDQYIVAELIENGDFERHINRVRRSRRVVT